MCPARRCGGAHPNLPISCAIRRKSRTAEHFKRGFSRRPGRASGEDRSGAVSPQLAEVRGDFTCGQITDRSYSGYMAAQVSAKEDRIELRVNRRQKALIEEAASLNGMSLSSYMLEKALKSARNEIQEAEIIRLSDRDRDAFLKALDGANRPNSTLKRAAKRFLNQ